MKNKRNMLIGTFVDESNPKVKDGPGSKIFPFPSDWIHTEERERTSDAVKIIHKRYIGKSLRRKLRLIFYRVLLKLEQIYYDIKHIN